MSTILALPLSGVVLAEVVDAFALRRWDPDGVLSRSNGTTARFFGGEQIGADNRRKIFVAAATALTESGILPSAALQVASILPPSAAETLGNVPPEQLVARFIEQVANHWDELAGAILRASAPISLVKLARLACLQLVTIDLAVRFTALLWLLGSKLEPDEPPPQSWAEEGGMQRLLRDLRETTGMSRDELAKAVRVSPKTLDGWLDDGVRPNDENLQDLACAVANRSGKDPDALLHELRRAYGLRSILGCVIETVGADHALQLATRLVEYGAWMLGLPLHSKMPGQNDLKMRLALTLGTLGRDGLALPFVESMLNSVWRVEVDPVWRTSIKAATRSWFERMQQVTSKLPPQEDEHLTPILGYEPSLEDRDRIAYGGLASTEELARDPRLRAAMDSLAAEDGYLGALQLKLRAGDAVFRGDLLKAIEEYRSSADRDPTNAEIHFRLGACLWQVADVEEGLRELEIAVALDPGWDRSVVEIAIVRLNQGRNEEASQRLEAAKPKLRKPSAWLLLHLGVAKERLGDIPGAVHEYEELLELESEHAEALDRLAHLYFLLGDKRKGAELAKRAAHLGFVDVYIAWKGGFYKGNAIGGRPRRIVPHDLAQLGDNTWLATTSASTSARPRASTSCDIDDGVITCHLQNEG